MVMSSRARGHGGTPHIASLMRATRRGYEAHQNRGRRSPDEPRGPRVSASRWRHPGVSRDAGTRPQRRVKSALISPHPSCSAAASSSNSGPTTSVGRSPVSNTWRHCEPRTIAFQTGRLTGFLRSERSATA